MPKLPDLLISVVLPLDQDAAILETVVAEVSQVLTDTYTHHEIILVDGGRDAGAAMAMLQRVPHLRLLQLSRCVCREAATIAGLESAIGDYVVTLIPETDPPQLIPSMVAQCQTVEGIVTGTDKRGQSGGPLRQLLKRGFHAFLKKYLHVEFVPAATEFRVLSRRMVNGLTQLSEGSRHLRMLSSTVGYQAATFPYTQLSRTGRCGRKSFWAEVNMGLEIVSTYSTHPLRWASWLGLAASVINLVAAVYTVSVYLFKKDVAPGWTTISLQNEAMFFLLFVVLAVLCEYVGRLLEQTRGRPLYFVADEKNSSVLQLDASRRNVVHESD